MASVHSILEQKGNQIITVSPDTSIIQALKLMAQYNIGALLVVENGQIAGILSERDTARRAAAMDGLTLDSPVRLLMTSPVYGVTPEQSLEECMAIMTQGHFRHLPVTENNRLVGLISIGDVVKQMILEKEAQIESLENYIWVNMI